LILAGANFGSAERVESTGWGFSKPSIVGHMLYVNEIFENSYVVREYNFDTRVWRKIIEVSDSELLSPALRQNLSINPLKTKRGWE